MGHVLPAGPTNYRASFGLSPINGQLAEEFDHAIAGDERGADQPKLPATATVVAMAAIRQSACSSARFEPASVPFSYVIDFVGQIAWSITLLPPPAATLQFQRALRLSPGTYNSPVSGLINLRAQKKDIFQWVRFSNMASQRPAEPLINFQPGSWRCIQPDLRLARRPAGNGSLGSGCQ